MDLLVHTYQQGPEKFVIEGNRSLGGLNFTTDIVVRIFSFLSLLQGHWLVVFSIGQFRPLWHGCFNRLVWHDLNHWTSASRSKCLFSLIQKDLEN